LAAQRLSSTLTLLPSQLAADIDHGGDCRLPDWMRRIFSMIPAQVDFQKGVLVGGLLRAEVPPLRAGNARERADCAPTTHFDARRGRF
jgi:hypothetical protein